ncbi:hypothetical protein N0V83_001862 [Neocucurbitaria cava]|uniref:DUF7025 domain-containing protein n=1 Tax=Neocucurbitaria cava TaxID=798079 RepID=A0A9W8YE66_9PLEO|nr:hypothetical protein N0V83_001862 [Neocucurbitaria cava]
MSNDVANAQQVEHKNGMSLEVGKFYRTTPVGRWEEWDSVEDPDDKFASPESLRRAIVIYRERLPPDPTLRLHAIVIQSPLLRKVLDRTFEGYDGISTKLKELRFTPPLHEFYYRWHKLEKLIADEEDDTTTKHLQLFHPVIRKEVLPYIERMQDLTRNGVITFDYLWTIFPSGTKIYTNIDGQDRIFIATSSTVGYNEGGMMGFQIQCQYIDCDGTKFVRNTSTQTIREFKGVKDITKLEVFPAHLHPDPQGLLEKLRQRGEQFEKLNGFHHMSYSGFYFDRIRSKKRHVSAPALPVDLSFAC